MKVMMKVLKGIFWFYMIFGASSERSDVGIKGYFLV